MRCCLINIQLSVTFRLKALTQANCSSEKIVFSLTPVLRFYYAPRFTVGGNVCDGEGELIWSLPYL